METKYLNFWYSHKCLDDFLKSLNVKKLIQMLEFKNTDLQKSIFKILAKDIENWYLIPDEYKKEVIKYMTITKILRLPHEQLE